MASISSPQMGMSREEGEKAVRKQVRGLLSNILYAPGNSVERRRQVRYPFPQPIYLIPLGEDGNAKEGESLVVAAKDISEFGIGFFHAAPLPPRQMLVSLQVAEGRRLAFVIEVVRTQTIRHGWCESSARFIRPAAVPPVNST